MQPILPRWMLTTLLMMLVVLTVLIQVDRATGKGQGWRWRECRFQSLDRPIWTAHEETLTARCAADKAGISLTTLTGIVACESGWNRFAWNSGGPYVGLAQHALSAYVSRIHTYEPANWTKELSTRWQNSRGQLVMSARMMAAVGTSPWSCA